MCSPYQPHKEMKIPSTVIVYATWDCSDIAQRCLESHQPLSRAQHRFSSVLERVPAEDLVTLKALEAKYLQQFEDFKLEYVGKKRDKYFSRRKG